MEWFFIVMYAAIFYNHVNCFVVAPVNSHQFLVNWNNRSIYFSSWLNFFGGVGEVVRGIMCQSKAESEPGMASSR